MRGLRSEGRTLVRTFDSDGVEIAFIDEAPEQGAGEPIVLVHGFASNHAVNWVNTGWVKLLTHQIQSAQVQLVAELGHAPATVEQLLAFKPGDFIELDLEAMIKAKVDGVPVFDCHYGTSNKHYAIKIEQLLTGSPMSWMGDTSHAR